jgi:prevent-host-death family protein
LSEVVEKARSQGPQLVTRRGKPAVVVISAEEYQALFTGGGSVLDILLSAPQVGDELEIDRDRTFSREVEL